MFSAPPTIVYQTFISRSTEIFLPWQYPSQINAAFTSLWLPAIVSLNAKLSTNAYAVTQSTILNNVSSTGYVYQHQNDTPVTGIVLSKVAGTSGIQGRVFPDGSIRSTFVFYDVNLGAMTNAVQNQIIMWYANYDVGSNVAVSTFNVFVNPGPPSAPQTVQATNVFVSSTRIGYTAPLSNDIYDPFTTASITNYYLSCTGAQNGRRYGTAVTDTRTNIDNSTNLFSTFTNTYPDSVYTWSVYAKNSAGLTGAASTITGISTLALTPAGNLASMTFPARYYTYGTIVSISTGTSGITNLVSSSTDWTSSNFLVPIHTSTSRGSANTNLMNISTFVAGAATLVGPSVSYSGFPATTPATQTQSNIQLSTIRVTDNYASAASQFQGFYLNTSTNITLKTALFSNSPVLYGISTLIYQSSFVGFQGSAYFNFYYDNIIGNPAVSTLQFSFSTVTSYQVSGVYVLYGTPSFNMTTYTTNMGNYFYSSPLLTFSNTIGSVTTSSTETSITNVKVGSNAGGLFSSTIGISSVITSSSLATSFTSTITMQVVANNPNGQSAALFATNLRAIVDGPSYTLVSSTLPASVPVLASNGTLAIGYRVWSALVQNNYVPYFTYNSTLAYSEIPYNNSWDISQTATPYDPSTEVQVFNGAFRSKGTLTTGYINYTPFYYTNVLQNTVNYSGISGTGYRYATFVWTAASNGGLSYNTLSFRLNTVSPTPTIDPTLGTASIAGNKLLLFYRIEDSNSLLANDSAYKTTCWVDGNDSFGSKGLPLTSANYFTNPSNDGTFGGLIPNVTNSGGNTTFRVSIPTFNTSNSTVVRIYCRVGVPMNTDFSFQSVSASLSITL